MTTISKRLDRIPFSPFHLRLLLIGGMGYMFDAADVAIVGFVLPILKTEWALNTAQLGLLAAGSSIGGLVGAVVAGWLGDRYGRRTVMMWALAVFCLATFASAMAHDWKMFLIWRIVAGVGTSAESAIIAPFLAEFAGPRFRGRYVGALTGFFSFGFVLAAVLGFAVVPMAPDAWRWALVFTGLPILMLLWWRRTLPESPRWLEGRGRIVEAEAIVTNIEAEFERRRGPLPTESVPAPAKTTTTPTTPADASLLRRGVMTMTVWFAIGFSYYAFFTWIPSLLVEDGFSITKSYAFSIAIYVAQIPGYFSAAWLNDVIGRRFVVTGYLVLGGIAAIGMAAAQSTFGVIGSAMLLSFFMNGAYAGLYAYTPELFPTAIRARAQGLAGGVSRIGSAISPILVGLIYPLHGFIGVFGMTATILLVGAAGVLVLGVNTRKRALEDISASA